MNQVNPSVTATAIPANIQNGQIPNTSQKISSSVKIIGLNVQKKRASK
jgi:hypothetical protein